MGLQTMLDLVFPPTCMGCNERMLADGVLCAACRLETPVLLGNRCPTCALPLPGSDPAPCDACMADPPPWSRGGAAFLYEGKARDLILAFKHGDRTELAPQLARLMQRHAGLDLTSNKRFVPVPLHWQRRVSRRYNQAGLLAQSLARMTDARYEPFALARTTRTPMLRGKSKDQRRALLQTAITLAEPATLVDQHVILVDDVLTTGSTLRTCAELCWQAGALQVEVLVAARVAPNYDGLI